jgi:hypothetical protein
LTLFVWGFFFSALKLKAKPFNLILFQKFTFLCNNFRVIELFRLDFLEIVWKFADVFSLVLAPFIRWHIRRAVFCNKFAVNAVLNLIYSLEASRAFVFRFHNIKKLFPWRERGWKDIQFL